MYFGVFENLLCSINFIDGVNNFTCSMALNSYSFYPIFLYTYPYIGAYFRTYIKHKKERNKMLNASLDYFKINCAVLWYCKVLVVL